jgi:hypothetical protein
MTTALGSAASPQEIRQVRRSRLSSRRQRPSWAQRTNSAQSVPKGMWRSSPIARHCTPQKQTQQIAMTALRSAAPASGGFGPDCIGRAAAFVMPASSANTSSTNTSTSANAPQEPGDVFAGRASCRRSFRCRPCLEPDARTGTPDLRPDQMNSDRATFAATFSSIHATAPPQAHPQAGLAPCDTDIHVGHDRFNLKQSRSNAG